MIAGLLISPGHESYWEAGILLTKSRGVNNPYVGNDGKIREYYTASPGPGRSHRIVPID